MKKIVIVGASSGLGQRVAEDFVRMGWRVGLAARREAPLKAVKDLYPAQVAYRTIDVTAQDAVSRFYELIELIDGMDVLLFASGVGFADPELEQQKLVRTLETNVVGFARIIAAAYKYFRQTANVTPGQIAAITSVAGVKCLGIASAYSSSKAFQQRFLDSLDQLAHTQHVNVKFTDIRPGFVRTPLLNEGKDYPMIMNIDEAAPLIEDAILRQKRVATIDWRWRIATGLWQLIPNCLWRRISINF